MISIIICSSDDARFDQAAQMYATSLAGHALQIVRIRDARGMAEGYNRGIAASQGDWLIFAQDNVELLAPDLGNRLLSHMNDCDVLGVAGTRRLSAPGWRMSGPPFLYGQIAEPHDVVADHFAVTIWSAPSRRIEKIQALDGSFLCARRRVVESVSFDDRVFTGSHLYDVDFSFRTYRAGFKLIVACDLIPLQYDRSSYDEEWISDAKLFLKKFASDLAVLPVPEFQTASVTVPSAADVVRVMTPPHWGP